MEKTLSFSLQRTWWLLRLNWMQNLMWERYWWLAILAIPLPLLLVEDSQNAMSLCAIVATIIPVARIFFFNYGLKHQVEIPYFILPVSNWERFACQAVYTVILGMAYSCLLLFFFVGMRNLCIAFNPLYEVFSLNDMFQIWTQVMAGMIFPWVMSLNAGDILLGAGSFVAFMFAFVCLLPRSFVFGACLLWFYAWAYLWRWMNGIAEVNVFFEQSKWLVDGLLFAWMVFCLWFAYKRFSRVTLKRRI